MNIKKYPQLNEQIYTTKLPNGLSAFVVPKPDFQKRYAFFATDYGGADRRFKLGGKWIDTPEGVAHFLEHKMFDTEDGNALTNLSANGASPNAYTSTDITAYHFECIEKFNENLKILLEFVSVPYFTPESVEKEQGIIAQEIRMVEDDPDYCLYYGLMRSLFSHNPMRDSIAGTLESIPKITADTLYDCHRAFYNPSNMALCVVGDVAPEEIFKIAQDVLPTQAGEIPERDYGAPEQCALNARGFSKSMEVSLPIFLAGCKITPSARGADSLWHELVNALALDLLLGHSSPLYLRLYREGHVNSDFAASFDCAAGAAYAMFGGEARNPEFVFEAVLKEIERLAQDGPDAELFHRTKKAALGANIRSFNSFESICSNVVTGHFRGYDPFDIPDLVAKISLDDIIAFYRNNLLAEHMTTSIISPLE
ncbi:MAG: insulinase family protein [Oscillospiraceae bacterium]|nr:insulinase family protein [Oscillospiraceae bacterium]